MDADRAGRGGLRAAGHTAGALAQLKAGGTWAWPHLRPGGTVVDPILREVPAGPVLPPLGSTRGGLL